MLGRLDSNKSRMATEVKLPEVMEYLNAIVVNELPDGFYSDYMESGYLYNEPDYMVEYVDSLEEGEIKSLIESYNESHSVLLKEIPKDGFDWDGNRDFIEYVCRDAQFDGFQDFLLEWINDSTLYFVILDKKDALFAVDYLGIFEPLYLSYDESKELAVLCITGEYGRTCLGEKGIEWFKDKYNYK